jgi:hypothetical protein
MRRPGPATDSYEELLIKKLRSPPVIRSGHNNLVLSFAAASFLVGLRGVLLAGLSD